LKLITVVTACFNEEANVREVAERVRKTLAPYEGRYRYEHVFIDNASTDRSAEILREIAASDPRVKLILNRRNFGPFRSPTHAFLQASGDAVIPMAGDLQDPPEMLDESQLMYSVRTLYYRILGRLAEIDLVPHTTGFGLYDKEFMDLFRSLDDPYPYARGLPAEFGFETATVPFHQPARKRGRSKLHLYALFDQAMIAITTHSRFPLRVATLAGFGLSALSFLAGLGYLIYKLIYWNNFAVGIAPIVIGLFFCFSVVLFCIGILGEYLAVVHTRLMRRPLVVEKERVNFDREPAVSRVLRQALPRDSGRDARLD
jgi:polyisoprenyl-phosphate glycosyltransferase